ncbi:hypothetical protein PG984_006506 [Apiospora sp. TS-2023a]
MGVLGVFGLDIAAAPTIVDVCESLHRPGGRSASSNLTPEIATQPCAMETKEVIQGRSIPYLPAEIRLAIWKEVASTPQVVFIDFSQSVPRIERSWLLAENDRVLLKDLGWGWRTDGWGFGKYASAGSNRNYLHHEEPGKSQAQMYKVATDYADANGPHPFGLPSNEELLSQSVANIAHTNDIARYSLRKLVAKPMEQHLTRRHKYELNEPRVMERISNGNTVKSVGNGIVTTQYLLPEEAYAAVTKVIEPRRSCQFHKPFSLYGRIMRLLYDTA